MNTPLLLSTKLRYSLVGSLALFSLSAFGQSTWNNDAGGNWNTASNWTPSGSPNAIGAVANFPTLVSVGRTVTLTSAVTVGTLNFSNNNNYVISGTQTLTLDVAAGNATINSTGTHGGTFLSGVTLALNDNLSVTGTAGAGFVTVLGAITGVNRSVTVAGKIALNGNTTYSGDTIINSGILQLTNTIGVVGNIIGNSPNIIINGGTLNSIFNSETIANSTNMTLNGGTWSLTSAGLSETLNTLTLSANSNIIIGSGGDAVATFTGGGVRTAGILTIDQWNGSMTGGAAERIVFGGPALSQTFLNNVFWSQQNIMGARQLASGEIVPVPEASSVLAGIGLAAAAVGYEIRRRKAKKQVEVVS